MRRGVWSVHREVCRVFHHNSSSGLSGGDGGYDSNGKRFHDNICDSQRGLPGLSGLPASSSLHNYAIVQ